MRSPFEPINRSEFKFLSWKIATLALTSCRVGEIQAFTITEPFLQFKEDRGELRTNSKFIPKVPSSFHLNEPVILKTFFPYPQDVAERALKL